MDLVLLKATTFPDVRRKAAFDQCQAPGLVLDGARVGFEQGFGIVVYSALLIRAVKRQPWGGLGGEGASVTL